LRRARRHQKEGRHPKAVRIAELAGFIMLHRRSDARHADRAWPQAGDDAKKVVGETSSA